MISKSNINDRDDATASAGEWTPELETATPTPRPPIPM